MDDCLEEIKTRASGFEAFCHFRARFAREIDGHARQWLPVGVDDPHDVLSTLFQQMHLAHTLALRSTWLSEWRKMTASIFNHQGLSQRCVVYTRNRTPIARCRHLALGAKLDELRMEEPSHILPHVFLGSDKAAADRKLLKDLAISHIINAAPECRCRFVDDFEYTSLDMNDTNAQELSTHLNVAFSVLGASNGQDSEY